ncbi:hypothetical protein BHM03_00007023 [Ensete ventricosum]|nr:hypothetical protein BHM03_00007023 [Ensete ventricosum]
MASCSRSRAALANRTLACRGHDERGKGKIKRSSWSIRSDADLTLYDAIHTSATGLERSEMSCTWRIALPLPR